MNSTGWAIALIICAAVAARVIFTRIKAHRKALEEKQKEKEKQREEERVAGERKESDERERKRFDELVEAATAIFNRNVDLAEKFLAIANSKVSILDEYGDENWEALPGEIKACLKKIASREQLSLDWKLFDPKVASKLRNAIDNQGPAGFLWASLEIALQHHSYLGKTELQTYWLYNIFEDRFKEYHSAKVSDAVATADVAGLSGVEFETYIARLLKKFGYDVRGTPTTGDQGADLIAERDGKKIIIQAKRYDGAVGNKAVQEVVGALNFYSGHEGWVVTNSTFTASARALAQKSNIKLIDGPRLAAMEKLSQATANE